MTVDCQKTNAKLHCPLKKMKMSNLPRRQTWMKENHNVQKLLAFHKEPTLHVSNYMNKIQKL